MEKLSPSFHSSLPLFTRFQNRIIGNSGPMKVKLKTKFFMRKLLFTAIALFFGTLAFCQNRAVTRKVKDDKGDVVPFATLTEVGTTNSVQADANGNFSITVKLGARITGTSTWHQPQTLAADFG